ncbi:imm68 putative immunity domain-containing protein [Capnocytophaga cynodegmi]|uniref:imm68 putative immunity domain-containing protein n=1 Tax=Capnocytophaga cynodegmi TaxID=28189 RepID=UPI00385890E5
MYIIGKYWNNYIGDTDDSLTLVDYLLDKQKEEITLSEIFSDTRLERLNWNFRQTDTLLIYTDKQGIEREFYYAIDLITDLAALLLECKKNGSVNLSELSEGNFDATSLNIKIISTQEENKQMNKALKDFVAEPLSYDLSEMCPEEVMLEIAEICEELIKELFEE